MKFVVGCGLEEFKRYYGTLEVLHNYLKTLGLADVRFGELGPTEGGIIKRGPSHLIVWQQNDEIIGHAIWHKAKTEEFRDPGDKEVREVLERLLGGKREFVELHEVWLREKYRGKGYGERFFEFFEGFIRKRGYDSIVHIQIILML